VIIGTAVRDFSERARLRRAHHNLRAASQEELEALVATEPLRNRWEPEPAPEILAAARAELLRTFEELTRCHDEVLTAVR
jgi:hypothetical protein